MEAKGFTLRFLVCVVCAGAAESAHPGPGFVRGRPNYIMRAAGRGNDGWHHRKGLRMRHIHAISCTPAAAQTGGVTTPIELLIEVLVAVLFRDWDNFQQVYQGLTKYFSKTP